MRICSHNSEEVWGVELSSVSLCLGCLLPTHFGFAYLILINYADSFSIVTETATSSTRFTLYCLQCNLRAKSASFPVALVKSREEWMIGSDWVIMPRLGSHDHHWDRSGPEEEGLSLPKANEMVFPQEPEVLLIWKRKETYQADRNYQFQEYGCLPSPVIEWFYNY